MGSICSSEDKTQTRGGPESTKLDRVSTSNGVEDALLLSKMNTRQDRRGTRAPNFKNFKNLK